LERENRKKGGRRIKRKGERENKEKERTEGKGGRMLNQLLELTMR
jgi:hypothetical protein